MALPALAIHVCADVLTTAPYRRWPALVTARDTVQRTARLCRQAGIAEHRTLLGEHATLGLWNAALADAATRLTSNGVLVVTFSGHTERGDGPIETTRWLLADGALSMTELAAQLARLPATARTIVIADTCYAAAITQLSLGPQPVLVIAGCDVDQTMLERAHSEFIVRLDDLMQCHGECSPAELLATLEADTPDSERPVVWTNHAAWWHDAVFPLAR